ncbi:MAG: hypothetical protein JSW72_06210 [Candidatus Bathyarchaeota archaeon]|nr:MAG: hypothetical protein JSW72_06210 [Candidatus Bathyarchaeota archaeon]
MRWRPKLGFNNKGMLFFALFYSVIGIVNFIIVGIYGLGLFHVGLVAVLSLFTAFGLYRLQKWSLWLVVGLFFIGTTYGAFMLNALLSSSMANTNLGQLLAVVAWLIYILLTWIATMYVVARRANLE